MNEEECVEVSTTEWYKSAEARMAIKVLRKLKRNVRQRTSYAGIPQTPYIWDFCGDVDDEIAMHQKRVKG